jgi:hypothetical protein
MAPLNKETKGQGTDKAPRVNFFDRREFQDALRCVDGWAEWERGDVGQRTTAKYQPKTEGGGPGVLESRTMYAHIEVGKALNRAGQPAMLRRLLLHVFPRSRGEMGGVGFEVSIGSFYDEALSVFAKSIGMTDREQTQMLEHRIKEFVRQLRRQMGGGS